MIKYYSTLTHSMHDTMDGAQKAEDKFVEEHFKELDRVAAQKRRIMKSIASGNSPDEVIRMLKAL